MDVDRRLVSARISSSDTFREEKAGADASSRISMNLVCILEVCGVVGGEQ